MSEEKNINSRAYWEARFQENWEERKGVEQTRFFGELLAAHLPAWFVADARAHQMNMIDWGCAEGEAVACLGQLFPNHALGGVDYAEPAIVKARRKYPQYKFDAADWTALGVSLPRYDVVISSNVLEHFREPLRILCEVVGRVAEKYIVLLVPFAEDPERMDPEHFARFQRENLPMLWGDWFCSYFEIIDTTALRNTYWYGAQALLIYTHRDWIRQNRLKLTLANVPSHAGVSEDHALANAAASIEIKNLSNELAGLRENLAMARQALVEQKVAYEEKLKELSEAHRETVRNYEEAIRAEAVQRQGHEAAAARLGPLEAEIIGLRENLAMARQALVEQKAAYEEKLNSLQPVVQSEAALRAEVTGLRENLAMARQALSEQQMAYEGKLNDFSKHYQQMARDREEALAHDAVARQYLADTNARLAPLIEEVKRQRQWLARVTAPRG